MMNKRLYFLSGLPRAGNTLLGSILNQNPLISATANSVVNEMCRDLMKLKDSDVFKNYPDHQSFDNVIKSVFNLYYKDWKKPIIVDRAPWGAPNNLRFLKEYFPELNIKIVVLVRDVLEVLSSFIRWSEKEPTAYVNRFGAKNVEEKCDMLMNTEGLIVRELIAIKHLIDHQPKELYHIIEYNDLVDDTENTINNIYSFLNITPFKHNFKKLQQFEVNGMAYDDEKAVGKNLHTIKTDGIKKTKVDVKKVLPESVINKYGNLNVWIKQ